MITQCLELIRKVTYLNIASYRRSVHCAVDTRRIVDHQNVFLAVGNAIIADRHVIATCYIVICRDFVNRSSSFDNRKKARDL